MKIKLDIECTPEEVRSALGLPDVSSINEMMTEAVRKRMEDNLAQLDPDVLLRQWTQFGTHFSGQMTDQFMSMMRQAGSTGEKSE